MVKYREILRLHAMGVSMRNISFSCKCSKTTVKNVVDRAKATVGTVAERARACGF